MDYHAPKLTRLKNWTTVEIERRAAAIVDLARRSQAIGTEGENLPESERKPKVLKAGDGKV